MQVEKATILSWLSAAYQDDLVKKEPELAKIVVEAAEKLEKEEAPQLVLARLDHQLSLYSFTHQFQIPPAIGTLQKQVKACTNWLNQGISQGTTLL